MNTNSTSELPTPSALASWSGSTSLLQKIRRLYFRICKHYRRLEFRAVSYAEGDRLIRESVGKPESEQWVLAKEEDNNRAFGLVVMLERRERIVM